MFTLATSCLTTSNLPWFMDLTCQTPMRYQRAQTKARVHRNPGTPRWARPAFAGLSVSCGGGGTGQRWLATWTGLWLQQTREGRRTSPSTELQSRQPRHRKPQAKPCAHQDPGESSSDCPQEMEPNLPVSVQEAPARGMGGQRLLWGQEHWTQESWHKPFWSRSPLPIPLPQFGLKPNYKEGTQPHPSTEN